MYIYAPGCSTLAGWYEYYTHLQLLAPACRLNFTLHDVLADPSEVSLLIVRTKNAVSASELENDNYALEPPRTPQSQWARPLPLQRQEQEQERQLMLQARQQTKTEPTTRPTAHVAQQSSPTPGTEAAEFAEAGLPPDLGWVDALLQDHTDTCNTCNTPVQQQQPVKRAPHGVQACDTDCGAVLHRPLLYQRETNTLQAVWRPQQASLDMVQARSPPWCQPAPALQPLQAQGLAPFSDGSGFQLPGMMCGQRLPRGLQGLLPVPAQLLESAGMYTEHQSALIKSHMRCLAQQRSPSCQGGARQTSALMSLMDAAAVPLWRHGLV